MYSSVFLNIYGSLNKSILWNILIWFRHCSNAIPIPMTVRNTKPSNPMRKSMTLYLTSFQSSPPCPCPNKYSLYSLWTYTIPIIVGDWQLRVRICFLYCNILVTLHCFETSTQPVFWRCQNLIGFQSIRPSTHLKLAVRLHYSATTCVNSLLL